MSDIFISYASADRQQAEILAQVLKAQGWTVWWDRTIPTGRTFDEVIEDALDAAKCVIVLWSEKSVKSSWVRTEAQEGADRNILIPILIEKVRIPLAFRRIQAANLIGWDGSHTASSFQELVGDIEALLGPSPKAEEKRKQAEAEAKRKAEEKRQRTEAEAKRKAEEKRKQDEAEAKRKAEEKRKQDEAEAKRKAEEKRKQDEAEAKRKAEEKRKQAKAEAKRKAEEKRKQAEAEAKRKTIGASEQIEVIPTSEPTPDELDHPKPTDLKTGKAWSRNQKTKMLAAICIVTVITIVLIGVFYKYSQRERYVKSMTYSLTTTGGVGGSVTKNPNKTSYNHGETLILEAVPNTGYSFASWSGDLSGSANPDTLVMDSDKSVTANFALKTYSLTATGENGRVTKSSDQVSYNHGDKVTLKAVPDEGYSFKSWSGDLSGTINPVTLVMDADKWVAANFVSFKAVTLKAGDIVTNSIGMKLVYIPAGKFMMGSGDSAAQLAKEYDRDEETLKDEFPQHQVRISEGFWMGQTEVTQGQYKSVMNAQPWSDWSYFQDDNNNPAVCVSWDDAMEFCKKLSKQEGETYRLPTEAEWEYACRAGTTTRFSFGDSDSFLGDYAWFDDNADKVGQKYAHRVGQKKPNPWGLYDMHGNVTELCSDFYDPNYYSKSPSVDPKGPSSIVSRCSLRGGSWDSVEVDLRCSFRGFSYPVVRLSNIGFRVVRSQ